MSEFKKGQRFKDWEGLTHEIVKVDPGMCDTGLSTSTLGPDGSVGPPTYCNPLWLKEWVEDGAVTLVEEGVDQPAP
jgi:hypothetical protein